jgi:addiction module HigA family antidote
MMTRRLQEIHPGEILNEEFLKPLQITGRRLSSDIDVPASRISEILNGNRPITADTAVRLGIYFSMDPIFWINLQAEYDVRVAIRENKKTLQSRIRVYQLIAA